MRMIYRVSFAFLIFMSFSTGSLAQTVVKYPNAKKVEQTDDYHGVKVADPYRWLEEVDSADTKAWVDVQNKITFDYLATIPQREQLRKRLTELWNYEKYSAPFKAGNNYFYYKNDGLQNQSVLYIASSINDPGKVFFDPNKLSADGTAALGGMSFTDDGKLVAYGVAIAGSDRSEWRVKDVETGQDLADVLPPNRQGGISWLKDNSGFFYSGFKATEKGKELKATTFGQKFYFHKLGTPTSEDVVIYARPDNKEYFVSGFVTEDGNWLIINVGKGTGPQNMVYYRDLSKKDSQIIPLVDKLENDYSFIENDKSTFFFRTDKDAARAKIVRGNGADKNVKWQDVIPEATETLQGVNMINNQFVLNYLKDAYTQIKIYD